MVALSSSFIWGCIDVRGNDSAGHYMETTQSACRCISHGEKKLNLCRRRAFKNRGFRLKIE